MKLEHIQKQIGAFRTLVLDYQNINCGMTGVLCDNVSYETLNSFISCIAPKMRSFNSTKRFFKTNFFLQIEAIIMGQYEKKVDVNSIATNQPEFPQQNAVHEGESKKRSSSQ